MLQGSSSPATDVETIDPGPSQMQEIRKSEDDAPGTDHTSLLPVEIWLEIFRYATVISNGRTLNYTDPFQRQQPYVSVLGRNASSLSIRTKCILVQVCSNWRRVAVELLYEHVVVTSLRKAKLVIRALEQSKHTGGRNDPRFGYEYWIRHLEIQTRSRESHKLSFLQAVAYIMTQCTNLQYISGSWTNSLPKEFLAVISKYHSSTLFGLSWEQLSHSFGVGIADSGGDSSFSPTYLNSFKNLRLLDLRILPKLSIPPNQSTSDDPMNTNGGGSSNPNRLNDKLSQYPPPAPISELPNVVSLLIAADHLVLKLASMISLPKLRNVVLDATHTTSDNAILDISLNSFLTIHGHSIKSLELIPVSSDLSRSISSPKPLGPGFFLRPSICPNLETIVFDRRERCIVSPLKYDILGPGGDKNGGSNGSITGKSRHKLGVPELTAQSHIYHHTEHWQSSSMKTFQEDNQVMSEPHPSLRWIGLKGFGIGRLYPNQPGHAHNHLRTFLGAYHAGLLPALERVQTVDLLGDWCGDWNGRDVFVWWGEVFEGLGLDFLDGERVLWKYQEEFEDEKGKGKEKVEKKVAVEGEEILGGEEGDDSEVGGGDDDNAGRSEEEKDDVSCDLESESVKKDSDHSRHHDLEDQANTGLPTNIHTDTEVLDKGIIASVDSDEDEQKVMVGLIDSGSTVPTVPGPGGDLGRANGSGTW